MFPETIPRSHMPLADAVEQLSAEIDLARQDPGWWGRHHLPHSLRSLIRNFELSRRSKGLVEGTSASFTETAEAFCAHALKLSVDMPDAGTLAAAPLLNRWCALREDDLCYLIGAVTGHPHLRNGARCQTSDVFCIAPDVGWARTWKRFYRLGEPDPLIFLELQRDGRIPLLAEIDWNIVDLPIRG